jgi:hypothetical protein
MVHLNSTTLNLLANVLRSATPLYGECLAVLNG